MEGFLQVEADTAHAYASAHAPLYRATPSLEIEGQTRLHENFALWFTDKDTFASQACRRAGAVETLQTKNP